MSGKKYSSKIPKVKPHDDDSSEGTPSDSEEEKMDQILRKMTPLQRQQEKYYRKWDFLGTASTTKDTEDPGLWMHHMKPENELIPEENIIIPKLPPDIQQPEGWKKWQWRIINRLPINPDRVYRLEIPAWEDQPRKMNNHVRMLWHKRRFYDRNFFLDQININVIEDAIDNLQSNIPARRPAREET